MADEEGWDLVMPFVVCQSQGGPFEDEAFTAGFACGSVYVGLGQASTRRQKVVTISEPLKRKYLPQLDLIAMHFGYSYTISGDDPDWCQVTFKRGD